MLFGVICLFLFGEAGGVGKGEKILSSQYFSWGGRSLPVASPAGESLWVTTRRRRSCHHVITTDTMFRYRHSYFVEFSYRFFQLII